MEKVLYFKDINKEIWEEWVELLPDTSLYHSYNWLKYQQASGYDSTESFGYFEDSKLVALCPVIFNKDKTELCGSNPLGIPIIDSDLRPSMRRKVLDRVMDILRSYHLPATFIWHPLTLSLTLDLNHLSHAYSFELLRYGLKYHIENTLVMNLKITEEWLEENISKYHRRHIKKARKKGVAVKKYRNSNRELAKVFSDFEQAHYDSAGKKTRSAESWQEMLKIINRGGAMLFVAYYDEEPLSYLLCGEFGDMSFGWSQVNIEKYEKEFSPRHLLEWETMLYYKKAGFSFYEVGERYFGPQEYYIPSKKEITISEFKERYGGLLLPKVTWYGKL